MFYPLELFVELFSFWEILCLLHRDQMLSGIDVSICESFIIYWLSFMPCCLGTQWLWALSYRYRLLLMYNFFCSIVVFVLERRGNALWVLVVWFDSFPIYSFGFVNVFTMSDGCRMYSILQVTFLFFGLGFRLMITSYLLLVYILCVLITYSFLGRILDI